MRWINPPDETGTTSRFTGRFITLEQTMHDHRPHDQPHHHLAFLAIHPDQQRHGLSNALLEYHHAQLDATETAAHLEATGPRNRRLYARHGYRQQPTFSLPDGPPLHPMRRPPNSLTSNNYRY